MLLPEISLHHESHEIPRSEREYRKIAHQCKVVESGRLPKAQASSMKESHPYIRAKPRSIAENCRGSTGRTAYIYRMENRVSAQFQKIFIVVPSSVLLMFETLLLR